MPRDYNEMIRDFLWPVALTERLASEWDHERKEVARYRRPRLDVVNKGETLEILVDLPGVDEKDVDISYNADTHVLCLKGEKKFTKMEKAHKKDIAERTFGIYERSIGIGNDWDGGKAKASLKDGVLVITIPKSEVKEPQQKRIVVTKSK